MSVFGSGNHHGSVSRQTYSKKLKAVRDGKMVSTVEYGTLAQACAAIEMEES